MTRRLWSALVVLLWLALPAMALRYWQVWDRLPANMASHFDAAGRANGWMSREVSLAFTLGFLAFMLAAFSIVLYASHRKYAPNTLSWALLAFFYVEVWTIFFLLNSTLAYNLAGTPISVVPLMVITPVGALVLLAVTFVEKRGRAFPSGDVLAEEVQSGRAWSLLFVVPLLAAIWVVFAMPESNLRIGAALLGLVFLAVFGMTWDGFHYSFTRYGLEVRTQGLRLKSIPAGDIEHYAVEDWNPKSGYGIRGVGNRKAYVWGSKGVRVRMRDGEIYLGHNDPARVIHDLDFMKQSQAGAAAQGGLV
jgi:Domain of unknown function (DUF1648)